MLFEAEFSKEIERQIAEKASNKNRSLVERMGMDQKQTGAGRFKIEGDDENQTLMWRSLMKDCTFYFDVPTIKEENAMRKTLQRKYDNLLQPGWRPALTTRRDLVQWACGQYNASVTQREGDAKDLVDCENY